MNLKRVKSPEHISHIFHQVLKEIVPTDEELARFQSIVQFLRGLIINSILPSEIEISLIEPEGSTGIKQTALRNAADIDLFIGLNPNIILDQEFPSKSARREYIRLLFKKLAKEWIIPLLTNNGLEEIQLSYAEHPYVSAKYQGIDLDIVICFNLSEEYLRNNGPLTAVDRTPHHSRFIRDHLTSEMRDEVRLLKYLFKCFSCYGDKSAIGRSGFIGYVAEILIVYYGSLWNFLSNFTDLEQKIINCLPDLPNPPRFLSLPTFQEVKKKFFPLDFMIILDPTDLKRNVGSSISHRAYYFMKKQIQQFLSNPTAEFFKFRPIPSISSLQLSENERKKFFFAEYRQIAEDHYTKFRDKLYSLLMQISQKGAVESTQESRFQDINGELLFDQDKGIYVLAFYTSTPKISEYYSRIGPHMKEKIHYMNFLEKHPEAVEDNGHLVIRVKREFNDFNSYLQNFLSASSVNNLKLNSIGNADNFTFSEFADKSMGNLYQNILPLQDNRITLNPNVGKTNKKRKRKWRFSN